MSKVTKSIFVGGLLDSSTPETLEQYFSQFGPVEKVNLIIDWVTGKSKRCAILICKTEECYKSIMVSQPHKIEGRKIRVDPADKTKKGTKKVQTTKIFLGQIFPFLTEENLIEHFIQFGKVKHLVVIQNSGLCPETANNCGYLEFYKPEDAQKLLNDRGNLIIFGNKIFCQPFKAKTAIEGRFLKRISNLSTSELKDYLVLYFQMGVSTMEEDQQQEFFRNLDQLEKMKQNMGNSQRGGYHSSNERQTGQNRRAPFNSEYNQGNQNSFMPAQQQFQGNYPRNSNPQAQDDYRETITINSQEQFNRRGEYGWNSNQGKRVNFQNQTQNPKSTYQSGYSNGYSQSNQWHGQDNNSAYGNSFYPENYHQTREDQFQTYGNYNHPNNPCTNREYYGQATGEWDQQTGRHTNMGNRNNWQNQRQLEQNKNYDYSHRNSGCQGYSESIWQRGQNGWVPQKRTQNFSEGRGTNQNRHQDNWNNYYPEAQQSFNNNSDNTENDEKSHQKPLKNKLQNSEKIDDLEGKLPTETSTQASGSPKLRSIMNEIGLKRGDWHDLQHSSGEELYEDQLLREAFSGSLNLAQFKGDKE